MSNFQSLLNICFQSAKFLSASEFMLCNFSFIFFCPTLKKADTESDNVPRTTPFIELSAPWSECYVLFYNKSENVNKAILKIYKMKFSFFFFYSY